MNDPHQSLQRQISGLTAFPSGHGPPAPRPSRRVALFPIRGCGPVALAQWPWSTRTPSGTWAPAILDPHWDGAKGGLRRMLGDGYPDRHRGPDGVRAWVGPIPAGNGPQGARQLFGSLVRSVGSDGRYRRDCEPVPNLPLTALAFDFLHFF
jgi:hypothetical protein